MKIELLNSSDGLNMFLEPKKKKSGPNIESLLIFISVKRHLSLKR